MSIVTNETTMGFAPSDSGTMRSTIGTTAQSKPVVAKTYVANTQISPRL